MLKSPKKPKIKKSRIKRKTWQAPIVLSLNKTDLTGEKNFPVDHYSYSSFTKFSTNPFMFKVNYVNGDRIETTSSAGSVLGKAGHEAMKAYLGGIPDMPTPKDEGEAIKFGHEIGLKYLQDYSDGFIEWSKTIPNRAKLEEKFAFAYFTYIKESNYREEVKETIIVEKQIKHKIQVDGKILPVKLKGFPDLVYRDAEGRLIIDDHKFTSRHSDEEKIDGEKLIQAIFLFFLVAAETGEIPYKCRFREFKTTKNQDNSPQTKEFEIVYEETPLAFELFYRFYQDVTDALLGKAVFVPNIRDIFDSEVSILAYIHRLDVNEERARAFKEMKVDNITDFLKIKIQKTGAMKKYLETVAQKFVSATTLNYKTMTIPERIKMKLAEHGLGVDFVDKIEGGSITLYRFEPSVSLKMSKIDDYARDIELAVETSGIRILAPIPNSGLVGFEIPNKERTFPAQKPENNEFELAIGINIMGETIRLDIREAPHLLVAGSTGSGKSVFLNTIIHQINNIPNAQIVLIDPKMVELNHFAEAKNVVSYTDEPRKIATQLRALVKEMDERYKTLKQLKMRNIKQLKSLPYIFVVIDEYGDLVNSSTYGANVRASILLLAQKARAAGIHIILTTQRPSVQIVDGDIKANFPTRIAFKTSSFVDSQIILDQSGAEKLLGKGDMLLKTHDSVQRLQGFFME